MTHAPPPPPNLDLDAPYRIGESTFAALAADLAARGVGRLVEFGAGASTVRFALALPDVSVFSIESVAEFADGTRAMAEEHGVADRVTVVHRPLRWQRHGPYVYWSYAPGSLPGDVDAVLIDGPPYWTLRGREACLHQVAPALRVGARIYLDDGAREDERRTFESWLRVHPGLRAAAPIAAAHSVLVADVTSPLGRPALRAGVLGDNLRAALSRAAETARGHARGARRRLLGGTRSPRGSGG